MASVLFFHRLSSVHDPLFAECRALYESSFPAEERRTLPCQCRAMAEQGSAAYHCLRLDADGCFAGLLFYWQHADFIYVEHLAMTPARRGQGLGTKAVEYICGQGLPVVLEMEYVVDELTERRWNFYHSLGFHCLPYQHLQPCYNHGDPPVALALMSYPHAMTRRQIASYELFMEQVVARYTEDALLAATTLNA